MKTNVLEINLPDVQATRALGAQIGQYVIDKAIVTLRGTLGTGKTTLVQGLGASLGVEEIINSPTFTMLNEYYSGRLPLFHLDLYRLKDEPSTEGFWGVDPLVLLRLELDEIFSSHGIMVIEWAEPLTTYLPGDYLSIQLDYKDDGGRSAKLKGNGPRSLGLIHEITDMVIYA